MSPSVRVGTAGWSIHGSHAADFPGDGSHLERYARQLDVTEINSSFHRPHRRATYERWASATPDDFRFSVKAPKTITHVAKLAATGSLLARFAEEIAGLGHKLGAVLVQLPPSLAFDAGKADEFFAEAREMLAGPIVCEPRHASWFTPDAEGLLATHRIARVAADPARFLRAEAPGGGRELAYYRWHRSPAMYRSSYPAEDLRSLADAATASLRKGQECWIIFDNTTLSHALPNAVATKKMILTNIRE